MSEPNSAHGRRLCEDTVVVFAARYSHNRNTGASMMVCRHIVAVWDTLARITQQMLQREAKGGGDNASLPLKELD
jgi:hypothetical protein